MKAEEYGKYIRGLRKNRKLTIRQLELYSGVSNSYLSLLENGKRGVPSPDILQKLAGPLNTDYEVLMERAGYIKSKDNIDIIAEDHAQYKTNRDLIATVRDIEEIATKNNTSTSDPAFRKVLMKALDLALAAKKDDNE